MRNKCGHTVPTRRGGFYDRKNGLSKERQVLDAWRLPAKQTDETGVRKRPVQIARADDAHSEE
jgi:hypothetical protein